MKTFTEIEVATGKITRRIRSGRQPRSREGRAFVEMAVDSSYDKIEFDGVSQDKVLLNPRPIKRLDDPTQRIMPTPRRIFPIKVDDERVISIKKKEWELLVARVSALEI